ncbi:BCNT-domain-containing protein, partial [Nadsonia fulvescens var. elongata DSM 6958]
MKTEENSVEILDVEDGYRESEDEDFDPDQIDNSLSDHEDGDEVEGEDQASRPKAEKRKREGDSDDEALYIAPQGGEEDVEAPGEGGLIKTRSQRLMECQAEKQFKLETTPKSSLDIDSLWNEMNTETSNKVSPVSAPVTVVTPSVTIATPPTKPLAEETITINRRYVFAGKEMTETKTVLCSSAEARAFLNEKASVTEYSPAPSTTITTAATKARPPPRKRVSKLDSLAGKAPKLNTLEKSKLDWQGFVDREGIQDDLVKFNKGKSGYLDRQDFLSRVEHRNEAL